MKELRNSFHADTRDLRYNLEIKRIEMRKLFTAPQTDDETLLAKQKEIRDLRQQLSEKKAQMNFASFFVVVSSIADFIASEWCPGL